MDSARLDVAATTQRSPPDSNADTKVQQAQNAHWKDEEDEGGEFEQGPILGSIDVEHCAKCRFQNGLTEELRAGLYRVECVRDAREYGERHCADEGNEPDDGQDLCGPSDAGHSVRVKRVANGQVALQRECHNRQHRRVVGPE